MQHDPPYVAKDTRYDNMPYRQCGKWGLRLPAIALGLWQNFGSTKPYDNSKEMIYTAFNLGITHFDLANNYGPEPGTAEETFGRVLKDGLRPYRDELLISTKAGYDMWPGPYGVRNGSRKYLLASLDQSLQRMGLDYVDIFYSHRPDETAPLEETMGALASAVQQGKAIYVGLSNYTAEQTKKAAAILKDLGTPCLIHQPKYSMLNRWIEDGLQDVLKEEGIGSIAFSPLAQGFLTPRYLKGIPEDSRLAQQDWLREQLTPQVVSQLQQLNEIAENRGQSLNQLALAWVLREERVTSVIIGASRVEQIIDNVKTIENLDFSKEELDKIDSILKG